MKAGRTDLVSNYIIVDLFDSNGEEIDPYVSESLNKVATYTLIVVLVCR